MDLVLRTSAARTGAFLRELCASGRRRLMEIGLTGAVLACGAALHAPRQWKDAWEWARAATGIMRTPW